MGCSASKPVSHPTKASEHSSSVSNSGNSSPAVGRAFSLPTPLVHHPPLRKGDTHHLVSLTSTTYGSLLLIDRPTTHPLRRNRSDHPQPPPVETKTLRLADSEESFSPDSVINAWELMDGLDDFDLEKSEKLNSVESSLGVGNGLVKSSMDEETGSFPPWSPVKKQMYSDASGLSSSFSKNWSDSEKSEKSNSMKLPSSYVADGSVKSSETDEQNGSFPPWSPVKKQISTDSSRLSSSFLKNWSDSEKSNPIKSSSYVENLFDGSMKSSAMDEQNGSFPPWSSVKKQISTDSFSKNWSDSEKSNLMKPSSYVQNGFDGLVKSSAMDEQNNPFPPLSPAKPIQNTNPLDSTTLSSSFSKNYPKSPSNQDRIVIYFTSLRGIRKTYEDCCLVRMIFRGFRVSVDERDISMDSLYKKELQTKLGGSNKAVSLPQVFIRGTAIGGAEEIKQMNEGGELGKILEGFPIADDAGCVCERCGDARFLPCESCNGSRKLFEEERGMRRCPDCNENGLVRCHFCCL